MINLTPRLIEEIEAKKLGIPHGWYGTRVSGTLMTGRCASFDDCLRPYGCCRTSSRNPEPFLPAMKPSPTQGR